MPRLVKKTAHEPQSVGDKMICMCGLSKNQPFCDGSHQNTLDEDEDKLYWYDENGNKEEIGIDNSSCHGECSGNCCQKNNPPK